MLGVDAPAFNRARLPDMVAATSRDSVERAWASVGPDAPARLEATLPTGDRAAVVSLALARVGDSTVAFAADLTEQRRMERLKDEFISVVNHELRTPLTSISGALGLMLGGVVGELPAQARSLADVAHKNCGRLARLIDDMLDVQKIESGNVSLSIVPVELVSTIQAAIEASSAFAAHYGVTVAMSSEVASLTAHADPDRLHQVLSNLLSNAAKYSPTGGRVDVALRLVPGGARVEVSDRGSGISEEFRERVFGKFAQADSSTTRRKGGTGLGLAISKAIVEGLGGTIGFCAREGGGTTFHFEIPTREGSALSALGAPLLVVGDGRPLAWAESLGLAARRVQPPVGGQRLMLGDTTRWVLVTESAVAGGVLAGALRQVGLSGRVCVGAVVDCGDKSAVLELAGWLDAPPVPAELAAAVRRALAGRQRAGAARGVWVGGVNSVATVNAAILGPVAEIDVVRPGSPCDGRFSADFVVLDLSPSDWSAEALGAAVGSAAECGCPVITVGGASAAGIIFDGLRAAAAPHARLLERLRGLGDRVGVS